MLLIKTFVLLFALNIVSSEMHVEDFATGADRLNEIEKTMVDMKGQISDIQNQMKYQDSLTDLRLISIENTIEGFNKLSIDFEERIARLEEMTSARMQACDSSPCDNGATCVDVNIDVFICLCRDGFFGVTCMSSYGDAAFFASADDGYISPAPDPVIFNVTGFNPGEHYDSQTGIYTVPYSGVYMFTATLRGEPDNDFGVVINVDGIQTVENRNADFEGLGLLSASISTTLYLTVGQQVSVSPFALDALFGGYGLPLMYSWFSGYLISAD